MKEKKKRPYRFHDHEKFIRLWQRSKSLAEFSRLYGVPRAQASTIAHNLRGRGVPLRDFREVPKALNYERLAKLAREVG